METTYKQKILNELDGLSENHLAKVYKFIHLFNSELHLSTTPRNNLKSLQGILKGITIEEQLFDEAKKSLFPFINA